MQINGAKSNATNVSQFTKALGQIFWPSSLANFFPLFSRSMPCSYHVFWREILGPPGLVTFHEIRWTDLFFVFHGVYAHSQHDSMLAEVFTLTTTVLFPKRGLEQRTFPIAIRTCTLNSLAVLDDGQLGGLGSFPD